MLQANGCGILFWKFDSKKNRFSSKIISPYAWVCVWSSLFTWISPNTFFRNRHLSCRLTPGWVGTHQYLFHVLSSVVTKREVAARLPARALALNIFIFPTNGKLKGLRTDSLPILQHIRQPLKMLLTHSHINYWCRKPSSLTPFIDSFIYTE